MTIFLILAPYGAFATLMLVSSATVSLFVAAAVCLMMIAYDMLRGRAIKMLGTGSAILFTALACTLALTDSVWSSSAVKLAVDADVLAIALVSLAIGKPFTMQYAREVVDAETARLPGFLTADYVVTWAWVLAFLLMMTANALLIYLPGLPLWTGLAIAFAARNTALYFTRWYSEYRKAKFSAPAATPSGS
ncbi:hypothetical protein [Bradyrhizobium sp.]|uniref:hypothetical protein n=1 Tax=Bradyrhizobium sp. TaxID=376 RepID=UPI003C770503